MANAGHSGHAYRTMRAHILAASTVCVECGHPGSDSVDYRIPWSKGGPMDTTNLKPCHYRPCPTCGKRCNQSKGGNPPRHYNSRDW